MKNNSSVCPLFLPSMLLLFLKEQTMKSLETWGKIAETVYTCSHSYLDKVGDNFLIELGKKPFGPISEAWLPRRLTGCHWEHHASRSTLWSWWECRLWLPWILPPLFPVWPAPRLQGRSAELFQPPAKRLWRRSDPCWLARFTTFSMLLAPQPCFPAV